jgi:hypothetical protein
MPVSFITTILEGTTKKVTGLIVPREVASALGTSRKPAVKVTLNGYTYRSTVATMGGKFMISLSAANRDAAGLEGGERLEVSLELDTEARVTAIPNDLKAALSKAQLLTRFEQSAPSSRKEFVRQVEDAKAPETRAQDSEGN